METLILARDVSDFFRDNGGDAVVKLVRVLVILVLAVVLRFVAHRVIHRTVRGIASGRIPRLGRQEGDGQASPLLSARRRQRADTIGSVLRSTASLVIFGIAITTILGEVGFDLGPVLASAGIIGVAVGFGAQSVVKDFLNGIFMLLEDQYGVGDEIDTGEAIGVVEGVALRTTRVRGVDGTLWHIRNGEIVRIGNASQDWSRALLDIGVGYHTDLDHAITVIKQVADDLWLDEKFGLLVLEEPAVWGVQELGADAIAIRLVVKTVPLEQWKVARELRRRLKAAFEEAGIELPFPQRSVWLRTEPDAKPIPVQDPVDKAAAAVKRAQAKEAKIAAKAPAKPPAKASARKRAADKSKAAKATARRAQATAGRARKRN